MSVRHYIKAFEETIIIKESVNKRYAITDYLKKYPATPVLFENVDGYKVIGNLWSTRERIARAMRCTKEELMDKMLYAMTYPTECNEIDGAPFMANQTTDFDLREMPIPTYYREDGGPYVTAGIMIAQWEGKRNLSFHRLMALDEKRFAIRLVKRHLHAMNEMAKEAGEELKVAVAIGLCPSILLPAAMSVEYEIDEMMIANTLRNSTIGEPVDTFTLPSGISVPAWAEYILEGKIKHELVDEGPFVDITGTLDKVRKQPVLEIEKIYHVDDPIFHALLSAGYEHFMLMGMPREPVIYRSVKNVVPEVKGVRLTEGSGCWLHGVVSIRKQRSGDGRNAVAAALAGHPSMKKVVIVDEDIDIYNDMEVEWAIATRFQAHRDAVIIKHARGSSLDPSMNEDGTTSKVGVDATKPLDKNVSKG